MTRQRKMGAVLLESERITEADVERALEHQRTYGGYFGEALVHLGIVGREEIDWALASQLDLPFIFPDAESADREATRLVSPAWALAHLAVPIVHTGGSITVVVADPLERDALEELRSRTGLEVEMALASASRIRELIRAVYGAPEQAADDDAPVPLGEFITESLAHGADRIGVSARGTRGLGWYTAGEAGERRRLEDGWDEALKSLIDPAPLATAHDMEGPIAAFEATLAGPGADVAVDVRVMTSLSGTELLLRPRRHVAAPRAASELADGVRADLRLLAAEGDARIGVTGDADRVAGVLTRLPSLVLGDGVRAAHVTLDPDLPGVYTLRPPGEEDDAAFVDVLDAYAFDALTVDLPPGDDRLAGVLAAAPLSFARVPDDADPAALGRAGIHWLLHVSGHQDGLTWDLQSTTR